MWLISSQIIVKSYPSQIYKLQLDSISGVIYYKECFEKPY